MTKSANIVRPGPRGRRIGYMGVEPKEIGRYNRGHRISDKQLGKYLLNDSKNGGDGLYKGDNTFDLDYQVVSAPNKPTPKSKTNRRRVRTPVNADMKSMTKSWLRIHSPMTSNRNRSVESTPTRRFRGSVDSKLHTYNKLRTVIPQIKRWKDRAMARYWAPPGVLSPLHKGGNGYHLTRQRWRSHFPPPTKIRAPKRKRE